MGNTCCKTAVGLETEFCVETHWADPSAIGRRRHLQSSQTENLTEEEYTRTETYANLFDGRNDLGENTEIFNGENCRLIDHCKPIDGFIQTKDVKMKDAGTKATLPELNNNGNNSDEFDRSTILSKEECLPNDDGGEFPSSHFYVNSNDPSHKPARSCRDYRLSYNSGLTYDEKETILSHFSYLKSELDVEYLLDYFIQEDVFTEAQEEKIRLIKHRQDRADLFLRTLLRSRKSSAYSIFLSSLCQIGLQHVCDTLKSGIQSLVYIPDEKTSTKVKTLLERPELLVDYIDCPDKIAEYFLIHKEFSLNDYEEVLDEGSRKYRTKTLLAKVVEGHKRRRFHLFCYALTMEGYNILEDIQSVQDDTERKYADYDLIVDTLGENSSIERNVLEEEEISLTLNLPGEREKERHIRKKAKKCKLSANEDLIHETECLISYIDKGSIIIRIQGCRKDSIKRLLANGTKEGISKLLSIIFANPVLAKALRDISTQINYKVEINAPQKTECTETAVDPKAIIESNSEFLIEELDAIGFIKMDIFTTREAERMRETRSISRKDCMEEMISFLIKKTESGQRTFLDELKKRKPFIWEYICPVESAPSFDDDVLTTCYDQFVDEISPSVVSDQCYKKGLIGESLISFKRKTSYNRRQFAQWIMQQILLQDYTKRNLFLQVLIAKNQIPQHVRIQYKEPGNTSFIPENVTETKNVFEELFCQATPKQKTGMKNKPDFDVSDKESGYSSNRSKSTYGRIEENESDIHVDENDLPL